MAEAVLALVIDGTMALLLVITIGYCWKLNKRIRILQDSKSELADIIRQFDESTTRASHSINEIYEASQRIADNIQHKLDKANYLADDLQFMIEKGSKVADKMEGGLATARGKSASSESETSSLPKMTKERVLASEDDSGSTVKPARTKRPVKGERKKASLSSLESMLSKASGKKVAEEPVAEEPRRRGGGRVRSKAERELFEALKASSNEA